MRKADERSSTKKKRTRVIGSQSLDWMVVPRGEEEREYVEGARASGRRFGMPMRSFSLASSMNEMRRERFRPKVVLLSYPIQFNPFLLFLFSISLVGRTRAENAIKQNSSPAVSISDQKEVWRTIVDMKEQGYSVLLATHMGKMYCRWTRYPGSG